MPSLLTSRLVLRPLAEADLDGLIEAVFSDPEVMKTLVGDVSRYELQREFAEEWLADGRRGMGCWVIADRGGNEPLGTLFLGPPLGGEGAGPELAYALRRRAWGRGFASEAAGAALDYAFEHGNARAVEALVWDGLNSASTRVVEKLGMRRIGAYPAIKYLGADWCQRTVDFDLWRLSRVDRERFPGTLKETALRLGKFQGEGFMSESDCLRLLDGAVAGSPASTGPLRAAILRYVRQGAAKPGFAYYRLEESDWAGSGAVSSQ